MKYAILPLALMLAAPGAFAADKCRAVALSAAEDEYGNYPNKTIVKTVVPEVKYHVAVGIGNPEDGEHDFEVSFANGCESKPSVREMGRNEKF